jgi:nitrate reductase alpha subunit
LDKPSAYFTDYVRRYTDLPMLVLLEEKGEGYQPTRFLRASDLGRWKFGPGKQS